MSVLLLRSDARRLPLPDRSVHCVVTSPPYFALRDYSTARWVGGYPGCDHKGAPKASNKSGLKNDGRPPEGVGRNVYERGATVPFRDVCGKCGARRVDSQIGLEATPEAYAAAMVAAFREVKRVLRNDGCAWVVLGDSYAAGKAGRTDYGTGDPTSTLGPNRDGLPGNSRPGPVIVRDAPPGFKPKDLCGIPWMVAFALRADGWYLRSAAPWVKRCLSGGTWLYARTQKGDMPAMLKDLVRLRPETVQLWDGTKWNRVVAWGKTEIDPGRTNYIEIELRSGECIGCTADHRWPTARGLVYAADLVLGDVIDSTTIPEPAVPSTPTNLPDDLIGWFVGLYLAEGCLDSAGRIIKICGNASETDSRLLRLEILARAYGGTAYPGSRVGNSQAVCLSGPVLKGILRTYLAGDSARNKCLTRASWQRSNVFLSSLLKGYLEGDGHWEEKAQRWRFGFCNNDGLARDLRTLGARLGVRVRLRRGQVTAEKGGIFHKIWRGEARYPSAVSTIPGTFPRRADTEIVMIGRSRARTYWDVEVENEPHLFALASGVLTHNSAMPESCLDRPSSSLEYVFMLTKRADYFYDADAVRKGHGKPTAGRDSHGARGDHYKIGRDGTTNGMGSHPTAADGHLGYHPAGRNRRNGDWWYESIAAAAERGPVGMVTDPDGEILGFDVTSEATKEAHFAVFPSKLIIPMIRAGSSEAGCCRNCAAPLVRVVEDIGREVSGHPRGAKAAYCAERAVNGAAVFVKTRRHVDWRYSCSCDDPRPPVPCTILDPFGGAGTTPMVAALLGRHGIACDLNPDYLALAARRIARSQRPVSKLDPAPSRAPLSGQLDLFPEPERSIP